MSEIATGWNIGQKLLDVLGLGHQAGSVTQVTISVNGPDAVSVGITRVIGVDAFGQMLNEFTPYRLVPAHVAEEHERAERQKADDAMAHGATVAQCEAAGLIGQAKPLVYGAVRNATPPNAASEVTARNLLKG